MGSIIVIMRTSTIYCLLWIIKLNMMHLKDEMLLTNDYFFNATKIKSVYVYLCTWGAGCQSFPKELYQFTSLAKRSRVYFSQQLTTFIIFSTIIILTYIRWYFTTVLTYISLVDIFSYTYWLFMLFCKYVYFFLVLIQLFFIEWYKIFMCSRYIGCQDSNHNPSILNL